MKRVAMMLGLLSGAAFADDFQMRADAGDLAMGTVDGEAFGELLRPAFQRAQELCAFTSARVAVGRVFTAVGTVARDGTWRDVEIRPASPEAICLIAQLRASRIPLPIVGSTSRADLPVTLRFGFGQVATTATRHGS